MHALGFVERFGMGILRMRAAMAEAGLPALIFHTQPEWFEVTLVGLGAVFMRDPIDDSNVAPASPPKPDATTEVQPFQPW